MVEVIPWVTIDRAAVPNGGELTLVRRGEEYAIRLNGAELMASRAHASEEKMAVLAAERLTTVKKPRVFIGGLGLGFTLRATLDAFPNAAEVVVAELVPQVITWVKGPLAHLANNALKDRRVKLEAADAVQVMQRSAGRFDALLLDIDNSPTTLVRDKNAQLYSDRGVAIAKNALTPGGVLIVWSAGPDARFFGRMRNAGFFTRELRVSEHAHGGRAYTLFIGETKPSNIGSPAAKPRSEAEQARREKKRTSRVDRKLSIRTK